MNDGRMHLAYKPEHAVDLDTGAIVAVEVHAADQGDSTTTPPGTLAAAHQATGRGGSGADARRSGRTGR